MCTAIYEWVKGLDSGGVGNLISTFAALIAIAGLIYQSHATRKQVKLQNFIEYTKRYQEIILNFPENINEQSFLFDTMSQEVKNKTMRYMRAYFDLCFEEFTLHEKKFIDNDLWSIWMGGMEVAFSKSAFKQAWATIKTIRNSVLALKHLSKIKPSNSSSTPSPCISLHVIHARPFLFAL